MKLKKQSIILLPQSLELSVIMVLAKVKSGEEIKLIKINTDKAIEAKLIAMGLMEGSLIKVLKNNILGPVIISFKGNKIILGKGLANNIEVEKCKKNLP